MREVGEERGGEGWSEDSGRRVERIKMVGRMVT